MIIRQKSQNSRNMSRYYMRILGWLSIKNVKKMLDIIGAYWEKNRRSKICSILVADIEIIIGKKSQNSRKFARYYSRILGLSVKKLKKMLDIIGAYWEKNRRGGGLSICGLTIDFRQKKSNICSIL